MTAVNQRGLRASTQIVFLAAVVLFMGITRVFGLVLHDPLLGYANNYDMSRIQACHQIWPADPAILPEASTPEAPLRYYTLDRHGIPGQQSDSPCFASSELLFTWPAIWLADHWNRLVGETRISLQAIGAFKATVLCLTALLASWLFYRWGCYRSLLAHALVFLVVLADPGVTLYLNTFYSEFSAVYFLYLGVLGIGVLVVRDYRPAWLLPVLLALAGLGLSKPQHMPLALVLAGLLGVWLATRGCWRLAPVIVLAALLPLVLYASGALLVRDATMAQVNRTNLLGGLLGVVPESQQRPVLAGLGMPEDCLALAGSNWHQLRHAGSAACMAAGELEYHRVAGLLARHPQYLLQMVASAVPKTQRWVMGFYGQVEGQNKGLATQYRWSVFALFKPLQAAGYSLFFCLPLVIALARLLFRRASGQYLPEFDQGLLGLALLQWCVLGVAVTGDGFVDIAKHTHLALVLLLAQYCLLFMQSCVWPGRWFVSRHTVSRNAVSH